MGLAIFKWVLSQNVIEVCGTIASIVHDNCHFIVVLYSSTKIWSYGIKKNPSKQIPIAPKEDWFDRLKSPGCMQFDPCVLQNKFAMNLHKTGV